MNELQRLLTAHGSDKGVHFHDFGRWYHALLEPYAASLSHPTRVLEIGVLQGQSLSALHEYMDPNAVVVGMDIDPTCAQYADDAKGRHVVIGDATNPDELALVAQKYGPFDVVIDDGSHTNTDVIASFEYIFPRDMLREGGLYIVEDVVCWSHSEYQRPGQPNHMAYFMKYAYALQQADFHISTSSNPDTLVRSYDDRDPRRFVDTIQFGPGFIAMTKRERAHWKKN